MSRSRLRGRRGWPVRLRHGEVVLRPMRVADAEAWRRARQANATWLVPWDATVPPGGDPRPTTFRALVWRMRRQARQGTTYPFVVEVGGEFAGQVTLNNVVGGSAQFGSVGYWIDRRFAGRGIMPLAVAMVLDHAFAELGLHRVEIAIRPENSNSLRVAEKLGAHEVGYAPRYLHIDGDWRDHRLYAVTVEDVPPGGLVSRVGG
ncbi:N-acetyltransferase GCN5 [Nocardioides sp. OK12]|uniref:Ribosomal-protein-alanine N-acetyltransferase n=1 Tax=Nocardioides marinisabuli TaxID=419476 RepID=A0A7Y9JPI9_9ACTN|nr:MULTISPECIES: GNAT family protein [Nocardioides]NYD56425.1 ribosomal-protein-alanine N-acetyltransferase [Nocardioides marinisabuli]GHJ59101.1 N-acetyltransferase GCN5 [Nocardioides sp. OK12]